MKPPREIVADAVRAALGRGVEKGLFPREAAAVPFSVDLPKNAEHGDLAANAAFAVAKTARLNPFIAAKHIASFIREIDAAGWFESVTVAKPAFINFKFSGRFLAGGLEAVYALDRKFGRLDEGAGKKVLVEFVSANPTGPLHVGHGRGAVVGDVVANVLDACGYAVSREYYINDAGAQVRNLGLSVRERVREASGEAFERFKAMVREQHGEDRVLDQPDLLPTAREQVVIASPCGGYVARVDAEKIGRACLLLGAGRMKTTDTIDHGAGVSALVKVGEQVQQGDALARLHGATRQHIEEARVVAQAAFQITDAPVLPPHLILEVL